ncbi:MAG: copper amine oxidase N-terminal domain-containing protein [Armatimonadota bacterium]
MTRLRRISRRYGFLMILVLLVCAIGAYSDPNVYMVKDRVVVPLRFVCEQLQCPIYYDVPTRSASMQWNGTAITFTIDKNVAIVNGEKMPLPSIAKIFDDRLYVPLRFMADTLGLPLFWSSANKEAVLRVPKDGTAFGRFVKMKLVSPKFEVLYDGTRLAQPNGPAVLPGAGRETPPAALPGSTTPKPGATSPVKSGTGELPPAGTGMTQQ